MPGRRRDVGGGGEALAREEMLQGTRTANLLRGTLPCVSSSAVSWKDPSLLELQKSAAGSLYTQCYTALPEEEAVRVNSVRDNLYFCLKQETSLGNLYFRFEMHRESLLTAACRALLPFLFLAKQIKNTHIHLSTLSGDPQRKGALSTSACVQSLFCFARLLTQEKVTKTQGIVFLCFATEML